MCTHNHSKGDAADLVDDPVTATIRGEPRKSETSANGEVLEHAVAVLRNGGRAPRQAVAIRSPPVQRER